MGLSTDSIVTYDTELNLVKIIPYSDTTDE